jgi:predicted Zn-dependent protease
MMTDRTKTSIPATERAATPYPLAIGVLTVGLFLVLATACATGPRQESLRTLVTEQEERAMVAELDRQATRFRWDHQVRLEKVLMRLLLAVPESPKLTAEVYGCDGVNAYVGGQKIHVCLGMLRFVKNDDELAVVLGHEMGHLPTSGVHGLQGGTRAEEERAADVLGLLYAHRAGYNIKTGAKVFERMAVELSQGLEEPRSGSHPTIPQRTILASKVAMLIDRSGSESDLQESLKRLLRLVDFFDDLP